MKKIFSSLVLIISLFPVFLSAYTGREAKLYLTEANKVPFKRWVSVDKGLHHTLRATVFFDGPEQPDTAISFRFESVSESVARFNIQHGTNYPSLPKQSYSFSHHSGVIPKGSVSADPMEINVHTNNLEPGMLYLMPISVVSQQDGVGVDESKGTVFYLIHAVSPPGEVARVKIGLLPTSIMDMFLYGTNALIVRNTDGLLTKYLLQKNKLSGGHEIAGAKALQKMDQVLNFRNHHLIALDRTINDGILVSFPVMPDMQEIAPPDKRFGTAGYNIFSRMISVGTDLYCLKPSGALMLYRLNDQLEWVGGTRSLGSGWNYQLMFHYKDALIGVDEKGDMWKHTISASGSPGIAERLGSGWDSYAAIIALNDDLLVLDQQGIFWKLSFGDGGFWAIN